MTKQELRDKLLAKLNFKSWTRGELAKNRKGEPVSPLSKNAVKWCATGLACKILKSSFDNLPPVWRELREDFMLKNYNTSIIQMNDDKGFKAVKTAFKNLY